MKYGVRRRDAAERDVIAAFEAGGASVLQLTGRDVPDLLVGYAGQTRAVEVKTNRAKLRPGQAQLAKAWQGSPILVVRTPAQARKWLRTWAEDSKHARIEFPRGGSWQALEDEAEARDAPLPAGKDTEAGGA